jgi:hypothetical protein
MTGKKDPLDIHGGGKGVQQAAVCSAFSELLLIFPRNFCGQNTKT